MNLASRLRVAREASGLTQAEVSQATGIAASNLSTIENGKVDIRLSTLERVLDALQVDIQLVPRNRRISLDEVVAQSEQGRAQLVAAGVAPSDPQQRLAAKERRGVDVSVERALLDSNA
jgi:XRE family transcriptional regulator, fatty acid utilization regulator